MGAVATTPHLAELGGFRNLNEFRWWLGKHPEMKRLRIQEKAGNSWLWPLPAALDEIRRLRNAEPKEAARE